MKLRALIVVASLFVLGGVHTAREGAVASAVVLPDAAPASCQTSAGLQSEANHAGLVIVFPDGEQHYCIEFSENEITGAELLRRSGLEVLFSGFGGLGSGVCRIEDVGCSDPGDCFCQCRGAECAYWTYYAAEESRWQVLNVGASTRLLRDGDADAWVWGNGRTPPGAGSTGICGPPAPAPQSSPTRTTEPPAAAPTQPEARLDPSDEGDTPVVVANATSTMIARSTASEPRTPVATPSGSARLVSNTRKDDGPGGTSRTRERADGGIPAGLVAFGAIAAAIVVTGGALVLRRRLGG
jgi:hypothetical protein